MATCSQIERWDAEVLQKVIGTMDGIHQTHARLGDTMDGVQANLESWGGLAAVSWHGYHGRLRSDVDDQGRQAKAVADALRPLYQEVTQIKADYKHLKETIENNGSYTDSGMDHWKLNDDGTIDTGSASLTQQQVVAKEDLEGQMKHLLAKADNVDMDIADAFRAITTGQVPQTGHYVGDGSPPADGFVPITEAQLMAMDPNITAERAAEVIGPLNDMMRQGGMNTPVRQAAFISQCDIESDRFKTYKEYASGAEYEGRTDLGNTEPGDGVKYKGRGAIQVTGRHNYTKLSEAFGVDFVNHPELVETPQYAFTSALWYWNTHNGNAVADTGDIAAVTLMVNGGDHQLAERTQVFNEALRVLNQ